MYLKHTFSILGKVLAKLFVVVEQRANADQKRFLTIDVYYTHIVYDSVLRARNWVGDRIEFSENYEYLKWHCFN